MKSVIEVVLETGLISALNIGAIYLAAFVYHLNWSGVMTVMVLASLFTSLLTHMLMSKSMAKIMRTVPAKEVVEDGVAVLVMALLSGLAVLVLLSYRFNLPMALGISILSGVLSVFVRRLLQ